MATRLEILIDGETLDLFDNEEQRFYITKIIHDIRNLETRNGDFSKSVTIPLNANNLQILGNYVPKSGRYQTGSIQALPVDVFIGGVPVLDDSFLVVGGQNINKRTLEITILGGTSLFFNGLQDDPISSLDFSELDLNWSFDDPSPNLDDIINTTTGICFARSQWYSNKSRRLFIEQGGTDAETNVQRTEVGESGFHMYCHYVLQKIFSNLDGLTIDTSKMDSLYDTIGFGVSVPIVHESFDSENGYFAEVRDNNNQSLPRDTFTPLEWITIFSDNDNLFVSPTKYVIPVDSFITIGAGSLISMSQPNASYAVDIRINGVRLIQQQIQCPNPSSYYGFNIFASTDVLAGDEITIDVNPLFYDAQTLALSNGYFKIENQGAGRGRALSVASVLPDISQRDFVREIFKIQNIIPVTKNKVVTLEYFESIRTNRINDFIKLDTSRDIEVFATLPSYARTNIMKYADNENVERNDMNSQFYVENLTLVDEIVKVELAFSASDKQTVGFGESNRGVSLPNYDLEWNFVNDNKIFCTSGSPNYRTTERNEIVAGDFISVEGNRRRVLSVISDFQGVTDAPWPTTFNDADWNHWRFNANELELQLCQLLPANESFLIADGANLYSRGDIITTDFSNFLKFDHPNGLMTTYYDLLTKSMLKPFVIQAWANIGVVVFLATNSTLPIYIEEFDAYFYLNKMEQWKYNQGTRLELIQINI